MSIEQKIAELLAESKEAGLSEVSLDEAEIKADKGTEEPNNKRNNVDKNPQGTKAVKEEEEVAEDSEVIAEEEVVAEEKQEMKIDVSEDVAALVNGEELSEEFKTKAATIFEAAVVTRVKQEIARIEEGYKAQLAEQVVQVKEGLVEKVDGYLDYIVEQWMEQNAIALESGIKSDILEGFVGGLKNLFAEHYIDVPEEKFDVLGEMEQHVTTLESKLDESTAKIVELNRTIGSMTRERTIEEAAEGLSDTEVEKFKGLAEELVYEDQESFKVKLQTIRENYFAGEKKSTVMESVVSDQSVTLTEEAPMVDPTMKKYISALTKR
jgi:hypothetical protein